MGGAIAILAHKLLLEIEIVIDLLLLIGDRLTAGAVRQRDRLGDLIVAHQATQLVVDFNPLLPGGTQGGESSFPIRRG